MQSPTSRADMTAGAFFMLSAMVCQELGASLAILIFPQVGALGAVALRLVISTVVLGAIARPRLRGLRLLLAVSPCCLMVLWLWMR